MPEKQWTKSFGQFALIVRRKTRGSETVSFSVVLVTFLAGRWIDITRYDTEHGIPHRDVLGARQGLRYKRWMDDISTKAAFEYCDPRLHRKRRELPPRLSRALIPAWWTSSRRRAR